MPCPFPRLEALSVNADPQLLMGMARAVAARAFPSDPALIFRADPSAPLALQLSACLPRLAQDALATGNDTTILAFLAAGVPVDAADLADLCEAGPRVVAALLDRGANLASARNDLDETPLHTSLRWHDLEGFAQSWRALLSAGVDPDARSVVGATAWQQAILDNRAITARAVMAQAGLPIPQDLAAVRGAPGPGTPRC